MKGNRAKGKSKESRDINLALDNIKAQIIKHYQRISDREAFATAEMVRNAYQGIGTEYETLLRAFDSENEAFAKRVGKDRSLSTYQKYLTVRKYLAEFIKVHYKRTDIAMNELSEDFIRDYCLYLRNEVGLAQSSVWIYSIPLKHIVTTAHYNGKIARNPFAQYKVDPDHKERGFLTENELQVFTTIELNNPDLELARDLFVFGCWTRISFIDIKNLTTPKSWTTFYNLEVAIALAFRLNTYEASRIRQKVLECLCRRKENGNSLFIWLGEKYMGN